MPQTVSGTFASGRSASVGRTSAAFMVPSGLASMKLTLAGLNASNTVKTQKSTNGLNWTDQTTYNSNQSALAVPVASGERWRLVVVAQQAGRNVEYAMSAES